MWTCESFEWTCSCGCKKINKISENVNLVSELVWDAHSSCMVEDKVYVNEKCGKISYMCGQCRKDVDFDALFREFSEKNEIPKKRPGLYAVGMVTLVKSTLD